MKRAFVMSRLMLAALSLFAIALSACALNGTNPAGTFGGVADGERTPRSQSKISHVIIVIQENRCFENFFAGYPGANAPTSGCAKPINAVRRSVAPRRVRRTTGSGCPSGDVTVQLTQGSFENNPDARHDWRSAHADYDNGLMD